jgi:putative nucleotidyltransferase with HDIG domain
MAILLVGSESMPWRLGQEVDRDITSRVDFEIEDTDRTNLDRDSARESSPDVYSANDSPIVAITNRLNELLELAKSSAGEEDKFAKLVKEKGWQLSDAGLARLREYAADENSQTSYGNLVKHLTTQLSNEYIVEVLENRLRDVPTTSVLQRRRKESVTEVDRIEVLTSQLQYVTDRKKLIKKTQEVVTSAGCPEPLSAEFVRLMVETLAGPDSEKPEYNPLWRYDEAATAKAMDEAEKAVPVSKIPIKAGDVLVRGGTVLEDKKIMNRLRSEHEEYLRAQKARSEFRREKQLKQLGVGVVVLLVTMGFVTYIASYQRRIFERPVRALGLAALILLMVGLSRVNELMEYPYDLPLEFSVAFVVFTGALLAIAYDQRFAFGASSALSLLVTLASRGDLGLFLTLVVAGGVTVFLLKEVRTRSKIGAVGVLVAIGAAITSMATGFYAGQELKYVMAHSLSAAGAAIFAGLLVQGILPTFEKLFGVATSMTLLEWCDASRPLLRRLAQEAPGTYSHSLVIGQMCEEACSAIEARGLLGRVGALYHDVGKLQKSVYFVENQEARMNRHDQLSPTMSLLIIIGHVKDGIELARAYSLPRLLHQFIAEHHGTTIVKYFHQMASEAAAKNGKTKGRRDREVPESEFRYPGPKPRSKESAILMLCDTCEGAVRASTEPTPGRIESTVHGMVMDRLNDGQFDDCDITLRELKLVEQSMVKSLCAIHHGRIKYPKGEGGSEEGCPPEGAESGSKPADAEKSLPVDSSDETPEVARQA